MKIIVTHSASDLDAIASSWMIKRFLPGWENAQVRFVPAGNKLPGKYLKEGDVIEKVIVPDSANPHGEHEADVIHVDTGLCSLDHHQIASDDVCATSLAFDYVLKNNESLANDENEVDALRRIVEYTVDDDHFQEVFWVNPTADVYSFSIVGLIAGIKLIYPKDDVSVANFGFDALDSAFHLFENRVWAEKEIKEKGIKFETKWGGAIAVETLNDTVLKLGQEMGYVITVRKDPETGNIRIKARPKRRKTVILESKATPESDSLSDPGQARMTNDYQEVDVDFTQVYEKLKSMDPEASWFLHISKRMLLNGSSKNPDMKGSKLPLADVIKVLKEV